MIKINKIQLGILVYTSLLAMQFIFTVPEHMIRCLWWQNSLTARIPLNLISVVKGLEMEKCLPMDRLLSNLFFKMKHSQAACAVTLELWQMCSVLLASRTFFWFPSFRPCLFFLYARADASAGNLANPYQTHLPQRESTTGTGQTSQVPNLFRLEWREKRDKQLGNHSHQQAVANGQTHVMVSKHKQMCEYFPKNLAFVSFTSPVFFF